MKCFLNDCLSIGDSMFLRSSKISLKIPKSSKSKYEDILFLFKSLSVVYMQRDEEILITEHCFPFVAP